MKRYLLEKSKEGYFFSKNGLVIFWTNNSKKLIEWLTNNF